MVIQVGERAHQRAWTNDMEIAMLSQPRMLRSLRANPAASVKSACLSGDD